MSDAVAVTTSPIAQLPGLDPRRLAALIRAAVDRCQLDLSGKVVLTEAATGAYVVTPVIAAAAGARRVHAVTRTTRHGTFDDVVAQTRRLADAMGVGDRIEIHRDKSPEIVGDADIVTNSGHLRPLDSRTIAWMKSSAVIPLMYEAWEYRREDLDLQACRRRNVSVAGTNEEHPDVGVFTFLGVMAVKLLADAGVAVCGSRILLLCDNPFRPFIEGGLAGAGATVVSAGRIGAEDSGPLDAILVAQRPNGQPVLSAIEAATLAKSWPGAVVAQFWGDLDRTSLTVAGVPFWPIEGPPRGHMGILPSEIGPEPIVRLQSGGLKVGQILSTPEALRAEADAVFCQMVR